ncbi:6-phosphogluconolactonase [Hyphococcus lacteus]|uniref:6-phosphogluconolactonase n=1 Tax=Hyphococcus lacteus TaxID=3143536 RepID=A0ABV3Z4N8_9PROT
MGRKPEIIAFESRQQMAERVADLVEVNICAALHEKGTASLGASGGSTPADLYKTLSTRDIEWDRVAVPLVDERWVAPDLPGSNEAFIKETLRQNTAHNANIIGLWSDVETPAKGLDTACQRYGNAGEMLDVVVLGMGNDGHTASWFPHADGLADALSAETAPFAAISAKKSEVTGAYVDRLTMTLSLISRAKIICLLIAGDKKRQTLMRALEDGPVEEMPVRAILRSRPDLWICWAP